MPYPRQGSSLPAGAVTGGWIDYINGDTTPINIPAGVETKLTLDATNGTIIDFQAPQGVGQLWNSTTSSFDFSDLNIGDEVNIRLDGNLTTTTINDSFAVILRVGEGSPDEFDLPFASGSRFIAGSNTISRFNKIFIGSEGARDFPASFYGVASDDATGFLVDIYVSVRRYV